jgi:DNA mismatch repair protein MutL
MTLFRGTKLMSKIRVLPDSLANKIAAGEVVERPSSVVKELVENSLDAGSHRIDIEIESGGKKLIRIVDDGEGMSRDDAIVAFERHATSKLRNAEDLESITTLGFRGEALPSIASVSRLSLRTKTERDVEGTEVEFNGGKLIAVRDIAWPGGTEIEVRDLFLNIPARRKFLKSDATESYHVTNLVQHYALANPNVSFLLVNNGRDAVRVTRAGSLKERAFQVLGWALLNKLVEVSHEADGLRVMGFVSNPQERRSSRDAQYLFVNGRFVRDQLVSRAVSEAYRSMMPSGTYPAVILFLEVPPSEVDVNVHPAKTEVKFLHEGLILSFLRVAVAGALSSTQPINQLRGFGSSDRGEEGLLSSELQSFGSRSEDSGSDRVGEMTFSEAATRTVVPNRPPFESAQSDFTSRDLGRSDPVQVRGDACNDLGQGVSSPPVERGACAAEALDVHRYEGDITAEQLLESVKDVPLPGLGHGIKPLGQIRDSYIVATDEEGLLLLDQHVVHERILFEQFRDASLAKSVPIQVLLIPETLDLSPAEAEAFKVVQPELEAMGIETMELSGRTIAVKTAPAGIGSGDLTAIVRELLAVVERERRNFSIEDIRDQLAASLACKAAIKVNMTLTTQKMEWLIDELMKTQNPMTCPHGRPIQLRFGLRDIERGFKRPV